MGLLKTQTCPYCGDEVDDSYAEPGYNSKYVECVSCGLRYKVTPIYKFEGFKIQPTCVVIMKNKEG